MHNKLSSWLSLIALCALFTFEAAAQGLASAPAVSAAQPGRIQVKRAVGTVMAKNNLTGEVIDLVKTKDAVLTQGYTVTTGGTSSVVLLFSNGASINLAFSSELNIETFLQDTLPTDYEPSKATEEPSVSTTNIKLTRGELVGNVKKLKTGGARESKFTVGTPVGAAGIRGTTFQITYRPDPVNPGRFTFTLTTVVGDVRLEVASGSVRAPEVPVLANQAVVIRDIEVNVTTNQVTATTNGQTVSVTAAPVTVTTAPVSTVAQVQVVAQQLAQALVNVVFAPATGGGGSPTPGTGPNTPPGSPGTTTEPPRLTNP
jgi:hypothetical protein